MTARRVTRVVVADDQTVVREGIVMLLGLLPGIEVVGSAADGADAVRLVAELDPDVVLMDLRMPRCDGVEATRRVRTEHPGTQVVVLATYADDDSLFPALQAGARGYLTKDADGDEIVRAIDDVLSGEAGLSPKIQSRLLERFTEPVRPVSTTVGGGSGRPDGPRGGGAATGRRGPVQSGDRGDAARLHRDGEDPHQQSLRQSRVAGPGPSHPLRVPPRAGTAAGTHHHLMG